jgi:predicted transcriptional regulator
MQLSFWYSALAHHLKDPEFWTDMLYYGMKITSKGEFAPHAKIS